VSGLGEGKTSQKELLLDAEDALIRRDWKQLDLRAALLRGAFPGNRMGWARGALAAQEQRNYDAAEGLLNEGLIHFPNDREMLEAAALLAQVQRDYGRALARWRLAMAAHPGGVGAHVGLAACYREAGSVPDARAVLDAARAGFGDSPALLAEYARVEEAAGNRDGAILSWHKVVALQPDLWQPALSLVEQLLYANRTDEAAALLVGLRARFADVLQVEVMFARMLNRKRDWRAAVEVWERLSARAPHDPRIAGEFVEALWAVHDEVRLVPAMARLAELVPYSEVLAIIHARYDMQHNRAGAAVERLRLAVERSPNSKNLRAALNDAQHAALAGSDALAASTQAPVEGEDPLFAGFESLGAGGEFGLLQRKFGAESLALLRWGSITVGGLTRMLEAKFAGVGDKATTLIREEAGTFVLVDTQYDMGMQTFIKAGNEDPANLLPRLCGRQKFLARKLGEDLATGERIFVYKVTEPLRRPALERLWQAVKAYGPAALLVVRLADAELAPGAFTVLEPGLMLGAVSRFSDEDIAVEEWRAICLAARDAVKGN